MVENGSITRKEARNHHLRHIITNSIGTDEKIRPDVITKKVQKNDIILMCTDGLTEMLTDENILEILMDSESLNKAIEALIYESNKKGGLDNISIILLKVE